MKRFAALLLVLALCLSFTGCFSVLLDEAVLPESQLELTDATEATDLTPDAETDEGEMLLDPDGWYYSAEDVAEYLITYGCLPENFITKDEARELGWEGGSVEKYAPGCAIGGDVFGNREGLLPEAEGRTYYECDIDTNGQSSRGAKRIVFSNDGLIYYTEDHYESFTLLYGEE
ncbi:MAG: ribonuclease [Oscillospiraceae bacterium]|nr:ribonuclease [Oscillospiraceae bacterium]